MTRFSIQTRMRFSIRTIPVWLILFSQMLAQGPLQLSTLRGTIRDGEGKPVAQAAVVVQRSDSSDKYTVQTDGKGNYIVAELPDGVYSLQAKKEGFTDAHVPSILIKPHESKTVDLTLTVQPRNQASPTAAPQFFDPPQFTVAGVTDTTNLGGHGSDTVVRTRDILAKETVSLGEAPHTSATDAAREKSLKDLLQSQPSSFDANHQLGHLLVATGRYAEAISFLEHAAAADPANYENIYDLALANANSGNYAHAQDLANKLLETNDTADLHRLLAEIGENRGDSLGAVRHFQRAAELDPSESHIFAWGAELLLHHAPEPAETVFLQGTRHFPNSGRLLMGLGAACFSEGKHDEAIHWISQASDLNPNDPAPYLFLGKIVQAQTPQSPEVMEKLHRFVTLQPQNADANYYYALGLWKRRNGAPDQPTKAEIESLLKKAVQINPRHAEAQVQLGIIHAEQGAYRIAISYYRKALEDAPDQEAAHYRLAQAYRQIGEPEKSKEELRIYGQLTKDSAQKQDRERREIKQFVYTLRDPSAPQTR